METIVKRAAALDVHKAQVTACVRVPGRGRERRQEVAEFQRTVRGLLALCDWLKAPPGEPGGDGGDRGCIGSRSGRSWRTSCLLVNARHVKQVPGRKTDVSDAAWLCQLLEAGLLQRSFVPPKPIRALRNLTRYRKSQIGERQREANRLHKVLEDSGIKLDCVATDILGVSGRAMLDALCRGTTARRQLGYLCAAPEGTHSGICTLAFPLVHAVVLEKRPRAREWTLLAFPALGAFAALAFSRGGWVA